MQAVLEAPMDQKMRAAFVRDVTDGLIDPFEIEQVQIVRMRPGTLLVLAPPDHRLVVQVKSQTERGLL